MRRNRRGGRFKAESGQINVTSLVDVAFTLLVIFIITAPILQGGVEVSIPQADVGAIRAQDDPFFVTLTSEGQVYIGETEVSMEDFESAFPQLIEASQPDIVYFRGDEDAPYGTALQVIAVLKNSGIPMALVGEPLPPGG